MQWLTSFFVLLFAACAAARSAFGNKLLVIMDDVAEKAAYSTFLEDVKG
jgi:oligosaccharyltransferase complex subunit beta